MIIITASLALAERPNLFRYEGVAFRQFQLHGIHYYHLHLIRLHRHYHQLRRFHLPQAQKTL